MTLHSREHHITNGHANTNDIDASISRFLANSDAFTPPKADPAAVARCYAETAVVSHPMSEEPNGPLKGRAAVAEFFSSLAEEVSSVRLLERHRVVQGNHAIIELTIRSILLQSGKQVDVPAVFSLSFDHEGCVAEQRIYVRAEQIA